MKKSYLFSLGLILVVALLGVGVVHAQTAFLNSELQVGSRGSDVTALQQFLATNSLVYPQGLVTGYFGQLTKMAVQQFQIAHNIPAVGRVGPMTLATLNEVKATNLGLDIAAPVMSQVTVSNSGNSMTVNWTTDEATRAKVYYDTAVLSKKEVSGTASNEPVVSGKMVSDLNWSTSHSLVLDTSMTNVTYHYLVQSMDQSGNVTVYEGTFSR